MTKPAADFNKDRKTSSGLSPQCRACRSAWRKQNAEKISEYNAEYAQGQRRPKAGPRVCRECGAVVTSKDTLCLPCRRVAYQVRKDHINRLRREQRVGKREARTADCVECGATFTLRGSAEHSNCKRCRDRARKVEYWKSPRGKAMRAGINHRRRLRMLEGNCGCVTTDDILHIMSLPCVYCGGAYEDLEHVMPLAAGGKHCRQNLAPSCTPCNLSKGTTVLEHPPAPIFFCGRA